MSADPLAGLLELVRREAATAATAAVRAELNRTRQACRGGRRLLSLAAIGKEYAVGRIELKRLIACGDLRSIERKCRGGRIGTFVAWEDAESVLAGRQVPS